MTAIAGREKLVTKPDPAELERLSGWLGHRGITLDDLHPGSLKFVSDPGGMCLEWFDSDGMRYEEFLTAGEWDEAHFVLGRGPERV
jgi:hypothetical protein